MAIGTGIAVAALCIACCIALIYNKLYKRREKCGRAFKSLQLTLLRRYDLVPSLVAALEDIPTETAPPLPTFLAAREKALDQCALSHSPKGGPKMVKELAEAEAQFVAALVQVFSWVETESSVMTDKGITDLSVQFATSENRIAFARQSYCDAVNSYSRERNKYPAKIFAHALGFREVELFELDSRDAIALTRVSFA